MKDEIKVQGVAFGPQPHDWLACQCSAIHAVSALPGKKYILGIPHLRPCDSRPSISGIIITKKVRYHLPRGKNWLNLSLLLHLSNRDTQTGPFIHMYREAAALQCSGKSHCCARVIAIIVEIGVIKTICFCLDSF